MTFDQTIAKKEKLSRETLELVSRHLTKSDHEYLLMVVNATLEDLDSMDEEFNKSN